MQIADLLYNGFWIAFYIIFLVFFFWGLSACLFFFKRRRYTNRFEHNITFFQIRLPPQNEIEIEAAEHFFTSLMGFRRPFLDAMNKGQPALSFEIVSKDEGIGFYVVVPDEFVTFVEKHINAGYPDAEIDIIDPNEIWDRGSVTEVAEIKLKGPPYFPIKTYKDVEHTDSMSTITSSMSKLNPEEVLAIQYILSPAKDSWRKAGQAFIGHLHNKSNNPEKKVNVDTSLTEGVEKKISKPGFDVSIRVISIAKDKISAQSHIRNVVNAFEQFTDVKYNRFKQGKLLLHKKKQLIFKVIHRRLNTFSVRVPIFEISLFRKTSVLNVEELATVFHFPNKNVQTPNIMWLSARRAAAPTNVPEEGLYLGINEFRNSERKIYMIEEDRTRHLYIVGQTGTGKSVFMSSLAQQDIENGEGVAYIDPHGSEIQLLLKQMPAHRMEDVILFDASDTSRPLGLNVLEAHSEEEQHMVINSFIALLYKLYDPNRQGIMGPKLERAIRNVMLTAMVDPNSTLVDVLRLLIDNDYSKKFIEKVKDPLVKKYWTEEVAKTSDFHKSETMGYFVSKFDRFVTDKTMRNILGQPKSAINFNEIMAQKKILLVDLSKGKIGEENSNFLGLILVPKLLSAALARASLIGREEFPNFYLYVDEFQNFATPDFATILSEARKYKLNLTVAHQFVAQLEEKIRDAVFGNVGTMAVFRVGIEDAQLLEAQFEPIFTQNDIINNPIGNAYIRLLINGHPSPPFSFRSDWEKIKNTPASTEIAEKVRVFSRNKYGKDEKEVEEYINDRAGFTEEQQTPPTMPPPLQGKAARKLIPF